jgi:C4-type Zn-finger protein
MVKDTYKPKIICNSKHPFLRIWIEIKCPSCKQKYRYILAQRNFKRWGEIMLENCESCEYKKKCVHHNTLNKRYCNCYKKETKEKEMK